MKAQQLKIGWSSRDVSTDAPINILGQFHIRVSEGVHDPVSVTALTLDNGEDLVCFLSCDLVNIRPCLLNAVREKVAARLPLFPIEKLIINATHTHTAPSYYERVKGALSSPENVPDSGVEIANSDEYREFLSDRAADAVCESYETRSPGGVAMGYGYAVVGHSRRTVYSDDVSKRPGVASRPGALVDGHATMYGNTDDDNFSHYEAGSDHFVNILYTFDCNSRLTGAIINLACPSQCSETRSILSADFWHDVREAIRSKHGDIFILPQPAAAGDISPRILHYKQAELRRFALKYGPDVPKDFAERKDIAERLSCAFDEVLAWARKDIRTQPPLTHLVKTVPLERRFVTDEEAALETKLLEDLNKIEFAEDGLPLDRLAHDSSLVMRRIRSKGILQRYEAQKTQSYFPMELHVLRIGDAAFATNSFELYMDFMHRIQARSPFLQTFVIQLCANPDNHGGYLCTERGACGKGYSASIYCNLVSPRGGQQLVDETVKALREIKGEQEGSS